ncbi:MAG: hypothetical protein SFW09_16260 [Hyphomicrobiaceae bacterium]|nr:hypothetical protein [Hyphomicrobiaceae bacterium]
MPPLIAAVIAGAGLYAGFRLARKVIENLSLDRQTGNADCPASHDEPGIVVEKHLGTLERDPVTGVYRPSSPSH